MLAAATLILRRPARTPASCTATIERERPTLWPTGPGPALPAAARRPATVGRDLTSLAGRSSPAARPVDPQVAADVERRTGGARVREGYGLAEASPLTHAQPVYGRVAAGSIGLPVTDTVALVVDPDDLDTPGAAGHARDAAGPRPAGRRRLLASDPRRPRRRSATGGSSPATSPPSTTAGSSPCSAAPARWSAATASSSRRAPSRPSLRAPPARSLPRPVVDRRRGRRSLLAAVVTASGAKVDVDALLAHCRAHLLAAPPCPTASRWSTRCPRTWSASSTATRSAAS